MPVSNLHLQHALKAVGHLCINHIIKHVIIKEKNMELSQKQKKKASARICETSFPDLG